MQSIYGYCPIWLIFLAALACNLVIWFAGYLVKTLDSKPGIFSQIASAIMEHPEYQDCLDLMSFYEVYCSPDSGFVEGGLDGWIVIGCCVVIAAIVAKLWKNANEKPH